MSEGDTLTRLAAIIEARRRTTGKQSYTRSLLDRGTPHCARKFGEEALETVIAAIGGDRGAVRAEAADAIYHLLVLLSAAGVSFDDVLTDLEERMGQSGHQEKASRPTTTD